MSTSLGLLLYNPFHRQHWSLGWAFAGILKPVVIFLEEMLSKIISDYPQNAQFLPKSYFSYKPPNLTDNFYLYYGKERNPSQGTQESHRNLYLIYTFLSLKLRLSLGTVNRCHPWNCLLSGFTKNSKSCKQSACYITTGQMSFSFKQAW